MSVELIFSLTALGVACLTSVVGIWVERDPRRAKNIAYTLSVLIFLACGVSMVQSYFDEVDKEKVQSDMARMLVLLDQLAAKGGDGAPALQALVKSELSAQSRANPSIIKKVAQRISDEGGNPGSVLGNYLPTAEVESLNRSGTLKVKASSTPGKTAAVKAAAAQAAAAQAAAAQAAAAKAAAAKAAAATAAKQAEAARAAEEKEKAAAAAKAPAKPANTPTAKAKSAVRKVTGATRATKAKAAAATRKAQQAKRAVQAKAAAAKRKARAVKAKAAAAKKRALKAKRAAKAKADAAKRRLRNAKKKAAKAKKAAQDKAKKLRSLF
jgi:hypothetical protein